MNRKVKMVKDVVTSYDVPTDRLTRLADLALEAVKASPESENDKLLLILDDDEHGGAVYTGFENPVEALMVLLSHVEALSQMVGFPVQIVAMDSQRREQN